MAKHSSQIEWIVLDEAPAGIGDAGVQRFQPTLLQPFENHPESFRTIRLQYWALPVALVVLCAVIWLWRSAQAGIHQVQEEIKHETQADLWAAIQENSTLTAKRATVLRSTGLNSQNMVETNMLRMLPDESIDSQLQVELYVLEIDQKWTKARIEVSGESGHGYRQIRYFRQSERGWSRISPPSEALGPQITRESTYFRFQFYHQDASAVEAVAPQLDKFYGNLSELLGIPLSGADAKPIIEIDPTEIPRAALLQNSVAGYYVVPSPESYLAPQTLSASELLLQSVALLVVRDLIAGVHDGHRTFNACPLVVQAIHLWAIGDSELPLARWQDELVRWRLEGMPRLPEHYSAYCTLYPLWVLSPYFVSIPLSCNDRDEAYLSRNGNRHYSQVRLDALLQASDWPRFNRSSIPPSPPSGDTVIMATLFDFLISRNGRGEIYAFLDDLSQYEDWETFVHAHYGLTSAEFSAEWGRFLEEKYGVTL